MRLKISIKRLVWAALMILPLTDFANAAVICQLTNYTVDTYHHGGVYLHGTLAGQNVSWIVICGISGSQGDCSSKATDRRLAVAIAAQSQGKPLKLYFDSIDSCSAYVPYTIATSLLMDP